ncbi:hypothetical protein [Lacticaseibacillus sp. GG6-2]
MTYSALIPYLPTLIGALLLVMYTFMRREVAKSLPKPADKATLPDRLKAFIRLSASKPDLAQATKRVLVACCSTALAYAATFGAWLPEATGWSGLFATWWWLLLALALNIASLVLRQRELGLRAHAINALDANDRETLHLRGDARWYAQLQATGKYVIAALVFFMIVVGCALILW